MPRRLNKKPRQRNLWVTPHLGLAADSSYPAEEYSNRRGYLTVSGLHFLAAGFSQVLLAPDSVPEHPLLWFGIVRCCAERLYLAGFATGWGYTMSRRAASLASLTVPLMGLLLPTDSAEDPLCFANGNLLVAQSTPPSEP